MLKVSAKKITLFLRARVVAIATNPEIIILMAKQLNAAKLEEKLKIARAREAARAAERAANPKPYVARNPADFDRIFYRDPLKNDLIYQIEVKKEALTKLGGAAGAGLLTELPQDAQSTEITKGSKIAIVRLRWYFGDNTPETVVKTYGSVTTRYVKKYDKSGNQSHYSIPYSVTASSASMISQILARFETQFNSTNGTLRTAVLGANGSAWLEIGYGSRWVPIATA